MGDGLAQHGHEKMMKSPARPGPPVFPAAHTVGATGEGGEQLCGQEPLPLCRTRSVAGLG
jgi:hypothetical protein